jgi:hypothetical protein
MKLGIIVLNFGNNSFCVVNCILKNKKADMGRYDVYLDYPNNYYPTSSTFYNYYFTTLPVSILFNFLFIIVIFEIQIVIWIHDMYE